MKYDIKEMTIVQYLEFLLINIIGIPIELFLFVFIFIGAKAEELNTYFRNYIIYIAQKCNFPLKE